MLDFKPIISINGRIDSSIDTLDRGLAYGDGLFETMLLYQSTLPYWDEHNERLLKDSSRLKIKIDQNLLDQYVSHLIDLAKARDIPDGLIKIIVTRGVAGRGYQPTLNVSPTVIVMLFPMPLIPESFYEKGVDVFICKHRLPHNPILSGIKHLNKLDYVMASLEWDPIEYQEALLFDVENNLVEATSRNVFIVKNDEIFSPSLKKSGVEGVAKKILNNFVLKNMSTPLKEMDIDLAFLLSADEVFLLNSVTGIWPVKSILGSPVNVGNTGSDVPGPITKLIQERMAIYLEDRVESKKATNRPVKGLLS